MASIDLITAAGLAYKRTWGERVYLLPMVLIPVLIKYMCFTLADIFAPDGNIIRMSLIMMPAYFAEGWLLTHWARTIMLGHRWPFKPSGDERKDMTELSARARGILSGSVAYLLINLLMAGYFAFFMSYIPADLNPENPDPQVAMMGLIMMGATFFLFRYIWFYIPLAINLSPSFYLKKVQPLRVTFQMIGLWLVCVVPCIVALQFIGGILHGLIPEGGTNAVIESVINFVTIVIDMVKNLIVTAGMAYGFIMLFKREK